MIEDLKNISTEELCAELAVRNQGAAKLAYGDRHACQMIFSIDGVICDKLKIIKLFSNGDW